MEQPTSEQIAKLPKWARSYIRQCERQRDTADDQLRKVHDNQTVTPFSTMMMRETKEGNEFERYYFDAHNLTIRHAGIEVQITLPEGQQGREGVEIAYGRTNNSLGVVGMFPLSYQQVALQVVEKIPDKK